MNTQDLYKLFSSPVELRKIIPKEVNDCWKFYRWLFSIAGYEIPEDVYKAEPLFRMLGSEEPKKFMDMIIMRGGTLSARHAAMVLNERWAVHYSMVYNGIAMLEVTRDPFRLVVKHYNRCLLLNSTW